ncbi:MAG TPA: hypothetical protein VF162_00320 [Streptosporangiaceae bacterium]
MAVAADERVRHPVLDAADELFYVRRIQAVMDQLRDRAGVPPLPSSKVRMAARKSGGGKRSATGAGTELPQSGDLGHPGRWASA